MKCSHEAFPNFLELRSRRICLAAGRSSRGGWQVAAVNFLGKCHAHLSICAGFAVLAKSDWSRRYCQPSHLRDDRSASISSLFPIFSTPENRLPLTESRTNLKDSSIAQTLLFAKKITRVALLAGRIGKNRDRGIPAGICCQKDKLTAMTRGVLPVQSHLPFES